VPVLRQDLSGRICIVSGHTLLETTQFTINDSAMFKHA
jgi:hypothetical protein